MLSPFWRAMITRDEGMLAKNARRLSANAPLNQYMSAHTRVPEGASRILDGFRRQVSSVRKESFCVLLGEVNACLSGGAAQ